jgi:hypothetical protein
VVRFSGSFASAFREGDGILSVPFFQVIAKPVELVSGAILSDCGSGGDA